MQMRKKTLAHHIAAGVIAAGTLGISAPVLANDLNIAAGLEISNMYLFRGANLGGGTPLVAGSLEAGTSMGLYAGTWVAGGDSEGGTEIDLYAGYARDLTDDIAIDLSVINYIYPQRTGDQEGFGDITEVGLGLSAYGIELSYFKNVAGDTDYQYYAVGYGMGPFGILLGQNDSDGDKDLHLDLSYQFNDEISFTISQLLDSDFDDDRRTTHIEVMYSLAFDL